MLEIDAFEGVLNSQLCGWVEEFVEDGSEGGDPGKEDRFGEFSAVFIELKVGYNKLAIFNVQVILEVFPTLRFFAFSNKIQFLTFFGQF